MAGFNYMVESLMSHDVYTDEGRCIPFSLDPSAKKKAIALHENDFTQKVGLTVGDIVDAAKQRAQAERAAALAARRDDNKRRRLEDKLEREQQREMEKAQKNNQNFVQTFDYNESDLDSETAFLPGFSFGPASRALPLDRSNGRQLPPTAQLDDDVE